MRRGRGGSRTGGVQRLAVRGRLLREERNITGTRKSDRIVDDVRPPTTASASGWLASDPRSRPIAVGTSPMTVARLVIAIGTNRERAAATMAFVLSVPSSESRRWASSTSRIPFETAMPMTMRIAHQRGDREALPGGHEREDDPHERDGNREEHDERQPQRLELRSHDHEDDHDGEAQREAEPREGAPHQLDLTDEPKVDVARARVALQRVFEGSRRGAQVASLGLHQHVGDPRQVVALDRYRAERAVDVAVGAEEHGLAGLS